MAGLKDLNNTLLNLAGLYMGMQQQEKRNNMANLEAMLGLGNQMGITPEMYTGIQDAAKKAGLKFPDASTFQQQGGFQSQATPQPVPQQDFMQQLASMGSQSNSPLGATLPNGQMTPQEGAIPQEMLELVGPVKHYRDFSDEVASEMGINPDNLIGGEPLKKYRQESSMRYRAYLKNREDTIRQLAVENKREAKALTLEGKREKAREALEDKKEKARLKLEGEKERAADERQTQRDIAAEKRQNKSIAAMEERLGRSLTAAEKRARISDAGADRRQAKREGGITGRFEKRREDKKVGGVEDKKKLITIYGPGGATKMVPISQTQEYNPPQGWSVVKPSKEQEQMQQFQQLIGGGNSGKKVPVYDINGKLLRYE